MFETPEAFGIALTGLLVYFIVNGLKNRFPEIQGAAALLAAAIVTTALSALTGLINTNVPMEFWPILEEAFILLATFLTAIGTKELEKRVTPKEIEVELLKAKEG
jgi:hypothetical protein